MNRFRAQALVKEFPVLKEVVENQVGKSEKEDVLNYFVEAKNVTIGRIGKELLLSIPYNKEITGSIVGIDEGRSIWLVFRDADSYRFSQVKTKHDYSSNYAYQDSYSTEGETVIEAIDREGIPDYIYAIDYGIETINHYSQGFEITLYKPAKDIAISQLILQLRKQAREEIEAEGNF